MLKPLISLGVLLTFTAGTSRAQSIEILFDEVDDPDVVYEVRDYPSVNRFINDIDEISGLLKGLDKKSIEEVLGKPIEKPLDKYVFPVAHPRLIMHSGLSTDEDRSHTVFYRIDQFAGIEVYYGSDGTTATLAIPYFAVDVNMPKLTLRNLDQRLDWDKAKFQKLKGWLKNRFTSEGG